MIDEPLEKVADYVAAGADIITVHPESSLHIHRVLQQMQNLSKATDSSKGLVRGIVLNPGTPVEVLEPLLDEAELISLLAVNPGWRGQEFIPSTIGRILKGKRMIEEAGKDTLLREEGGITRDNNAEGARHE